MVLFSACLSLHKTDSIEFLMRRRMYKLLDIFISIKYEYILKYSNNMTDCILLVSETFSNKLKAR